MKAHQKYFALIMMVLSVLLASMAARAQTEMELSCRAKAKETALEVYQGCITEAKTQRIKNIRSDYKAEMEAIKAKYEGQLQELKGGTGTSSGKNSAANLPRAEKPGVGIVKSLPQKQFDNGPALPVQGQSQGVGVIDAGELE